MYQKDGREHSGVGWKANPHVLSMARTLFWPCDCWQKQQKDFWTGEQHVTTPQVNKNISTEETWSWIPDFKKEKILHPKKEKLQLCPYLSCMSKHLGTWKRRNVIVQIITDPTEKTNSEFFGQKCHYITIWVKSMQFYFVQQNTQIVHIDGERVQETGPMCIWSFSSALYIIQ